MIKDIENIQSFDGIMDMLDDRKPGGRGNYGPMFGD
jgi:hypothetical protein